MTEVQVHDFDSMHALVRNLPDPTSVNQSDPVQSSIPSSLDSYRTLQPQHHYSTSISQSRSRRSLASLARERTSSALATLTSRNTNSIPSLRSATSSGSLSQQHSTPSNNNRPSVARTPSSPSQLPSNPNSQRRASGVPLAALENNRQSTASQMSVNGNAAERPNGRMHQTHSRILRMTDDDRPFTKDFKDLFSTLITSLPLGPHRVRFVRVDNTFTSEEALQNLGSLKFSQSNRVPDPKNPMRSVITTTTTTFSMNRDMARNTCQRFVDARMIESAESRTQTTFVARGGIWALTPKGTAILTRFCSRNGIVVRHIDPLVRREQMQIVALERDAETDKLHQDKATVELIFRRFIGQEGPNLKSTTSLADSDSVSEYASGLVGVKMAKERRVVDRIVQNTFTGKAASDWLLDCTTTIDRRETYEMAELFVKYELIAPVIEDRSYTRAHPMATYFQPTKYAIYTVTERGQRLCSWKGRPPSLSSTDSHDEKRTRMPRDGNVARLHAILADAALRLLFKEFLRQSLCEENLLFYTEVRDFTANYRNLERKGKINSPEAVRETLAAAYGLYNSFLAAGAPSELNIDHSLRNRMNTRMITTDTDTSKLRESLVDVVELFEQAQNTVFKLMASDSVPKFIRQPQYASVLRDHDFDVGAAERAFSPAPEVSLSRSTTVRE